MASNTLASKRATWWGATSLLNWATLAFLTQWTGSIPPFLLTSLSFAFAGVLAISVYFLTGRKKILIAAIKQPKIAWLLGIYGLFGYHLLYFIAQKNAPSAEAGLISSLWPLLIVLMSGFLPGGRLRFIHLLGGLYGFAGVVLLVGADNLSLSGKYSYGYIAAFLAALIWSSYSVLSRLMAHIPTEAVAWNCLVTAVLASVCHLLWEAPAGADANYWAVILLGLGPVGSAFFSWDIGMKHGNVRLLGLLAYATPLLSTLILIASGITQPSANLLIAALLICGGALIGSGLLARKYT